MNRFSFGLPTLDKLTNGIDIGQLIIIGGEAGSGKTALCRTICESNFKEYEERYLYPKPEDYCSDPDRYVMFDLDVLNIGSGVEFYSDAEIDIGHNEPPYGNYNNFSLFARSLREEAVSNYKAAIFTIPLNRPNADYPNNPPNYSIWRMADVVLTLNKDKKTCHIVKNRHGASGVVNVEFVNNGLDKAIMRERL
jgi:replicative DNA helicase